LTASDRVAIARPNAINFSIRKIIENLPKIKHWKIIHGSYLELGNRKATWFIDPPYQFGGHSYVESNRNIDFELLGQWCAGRLGQVIVCENTKATWMDFTPLVSNHGSMYTTTEAIWTNMELNKPGHQSEIFKTFP
jgi:16S rRNA G966 N2-methylase RsmD